MQSTDETDGQTMLFGRIFPGMGLIGLAATLAANLAAIYHYKKVSAVFFSSSWWSAWFPNYVIWTVLFLVGFKFLRRKSAVSPSEGED